MQDSRELSEPIWVLAKDVRVGDRIFRGKSWKDDYAHRVPEVIYITPSNPYSDKIHLFTDEWYPNEIAGPGSSHKRRIERILTPTILSYDKAIAVQIIPALHKPLPKY